MVPKINNIYLSSITILFFVISPFLALFLIIYGIYNRNITSYFFFAVFCGLLAYLTAPTGDLFRHTIEYYYLRYSSIPTIFTSYSDYITQILAYILVVNNIPYPFLRFFLTTIAYCILFYLFNYYIDTSYLNYSKRDIFLRFVLLFIISDFFILVIGVRYRLAAVLFILAYHCFVNLHKNILGLLILLFSVFTHSSFILFSIILFVITQFKFDKKKAIILLIISFIIGYFLSSMIIMLFNGSGLLYSNYISDGKWGTSRYDTIENVYRKIEYVFNRLIYIFIVFILIKNYYNKSDITSRFFYACFLSFCLLNAFATPSERILNLNILFSCYYIMHNESINKIKNDKVFSLVSKILIVFFVVRVLGFSTNIIASEYQRIIQPIYYIFKFDFDQKWIINNLDSNGSWDKQKHK